MSDDIAKCVDCDRLFKRGYRSTACRCPKCQHLREEEAAETARICKDFFAEKDISDKGY